jgi:hypothetical protein
MAGRPISPKCPHCGFALFKTEKAGQIILTDEYRYCRNEKCRAYGVHVASCNQIKKQIAPVGNSSIKHKRAAQPVDKKSHPQPNPPPSNPPSNPSPNTTTSTMNSSTQPLSIIEQGENNIIREARMKIVSEISGHQTKCLTALSLAVVLQELGDGDLANVLIERYELDKLYDIKKIVK